MDEFELLEVVMPNTPAPEGAVLRQGKTENKVSDKQQSMYQSGVGKLLHLTMMSRPDVLNSVSKLSRFMMGATLMHMKAMYQIMKYCIGTPNCGLTLKPNMKWDGDPEIEFIVNGKADSEYAKDPEMQHSVSGYSTCLCGAPITMKSQMQQSTTLSVMDAEYVTSTECAQDMLFIMRLLELLNWIESEETNDFGNSQQRHSGFIK